MLDLLAFLDVLLAVLGFITSISLSSRFHTSLTPLDISKIYSLATLAVFASLLNSMLIDVSLNPLTYICIGSCLLLSPISAFCLLCSPIFNYSLGIWVAALTLFIFNLLFTLYNIARCARLTSNLVEALQIGLPDNSLACPDTSLAALTFRGSPLTTLTFEDDLYLLCLPCPNFTRSASF